MNEHNPHDLHCTESFAVHWALNTGIEPVAGKTVWEPACGLGHISRVLQSRGFNVLSTDIASYGYADQAAEEDFFGIEECDPSVNLIMTCPPAHLAEKFVRQSIDLMRENGGAVLMLLNHEFDCVAHRRDLFEYERFASKMVLTKRPKRIIPNIVRVVGVPAPDHQPAMSWYYWNWMYDGEPVHLFLPEKKDEPT